MPKLFNYFLCLAILSGCTLKNEQDTALKPENNPVRISHQEELDFFNEVELWLNPSAKNFGKDFAKKRNAFFKNLASRGFVPAKAVLMLFDFEYYQGPVHTPNKKAFDFLMAAADSGDISSACAIPVLYKQFFPDRRLISNPDSLEKYINIGANAGHFACEERKSNLLRRKGEEDYLKSGKAQGNNKINPDNAFFEIVNKEADQYEIKSAREYYYAAMLKRQIMAVYIKPVSSDRINRSLCWGALMGRVQNSYNDVLIKHSVYEDQFFSSEIKGSDIKDLINKWSNLKSESFRNSITSEDCVRFEEN